MNTIIYFLVLHLILLLPGYVFVRLLKLFPNKPLIQLSLGYVTVTVISSLSMLIAYATGFPYKIIQIVGIILIAASIIFFIKNKYWRGLREATIPLLAIGILSAMSTLLLLLPVTKLSNIIPDPNPLPGRNYSTLNVKVLNVAQTNANDNYVPYRQAQFILNRSDPLKDSFISEWGVHFFQRTPLLGGVTAFILNLFGDHVPIAYTWDVTANDTAMTYAKFQIIAHILNAIFILPAYVLIKHFFGRKAAVITILLLATNQFFIYNSIFSWPKSFTAFFILLSWIMLFCLPRKWPIVLTGSLLGGVAYLTHDLAVLFIGASFLILLCQKRFRDALLSVAGMLAGLAPWFVTSGLIFKKPSSFIYYPFSLKDIPQIEQKDQILRQFFHTPPLEIISIKIQSLLFLLTPYQLIFETGRDVLERRLWAVGLFSLPGAVGLGLFVFTVISLFQKLKSTLLLLALAILPIILSVIIIGWPKGLGAIHFAQPSVVLLSALGVGGVLLFKKPIVMMSVILFSHFATFTYFVLYSYGFGSFSVWLQNIRSICVLILVVLLLFFTYLSIYASISPKFRNIPFLKKLYASYL